MPDRVAIYFHDLEEPNWLAFSEAITHFTGEGYTAVDPQTFADPVAGRGGLFVSFDDSFASWHRALPLFARLGLTATFYVNTLPFTPNLSNEAMTGYFDRLAHHGERRALCASMLREIRAMGHVIGCHSHSHFVLADLPPDQWDREIAESKDVLQDLLGEDIRHFSYPYGMRRFFTPELSAYCRDLGFETIATGIPGLQFRSPIDPYALHRTRWDLSQHLEHNLTDLRIDGRLFEKWTGRSAVG